MIARSNRSELFAIAAIAGIALLYLPLFVWKTVWLGQGDIQVFFRAGWAVWSGYPLYQVTDYHGWSYHYPPTFALLMGPLGDPLPGYPRPWWALPFPAAAVVWYLLSATFVILAAQVWATALERYRPFVSQSDFGRFTLRVGPVLAVIPYIGDGLARGQPTPLLLLLCVGFLVLYSEKRATSAAFALALAIAIKIFPIVLAVLPLLRRDWKCLAWLSVWCVVVLIIFPAICIGPSATLDLYKAMWTDHLAGLVSGFLNSKYIRETDPGGYDAVSVGGAIARIAAGHPFESAPLPVWVSSLQYLLDAALVAAVAVLGRGGFWDWRRAQPAPGYSFLLAGAILVAAIPLMVSVAKPNYVSFAAPLLGVLAIETWRRAGEIRLTPGMIAWAAFSWLAMISLELRSNLLLLAAPMTWALLLLIPKSLRLVAELSAKGETPQTHARTIVA